MDRKKKVVIGIVTVVTLGAGAAAALWSASGSGSGTARSVTAQVVTVTAATGAADLYPGFTGGDVHFTLSNPNPYPVTFDVDDSRDGHLEQPGVRGDQHHRGGRRPGSVSPSPPEQRTSPRRSRTSSR